MKFWAWIKKNWYYFLIIPLVITGFKVLIVIFSKGTDLTGMPDLTDLERNKEDKNKILENEEKEAKRLVNEKLEKEKEKINSGEMNPSDVFNEELIGKKK